MNSKASASASGAVTAHDYFLLEGTIDAHCDKLLKEIPSRVRHTQVYFDFSKAGRINSMGIALLLRCFKEIGSRAEIRLEGLSPMHNMLFKMTGVFLLAAPAQSPGREGGVR